MVNSVYFKRFVVHVVGEKFLNGNDKSFLSEEANLKKLSIEPRERRQPGLGNRGRADRGRLARGRLARERIQMKAHFLT